MKKIKKVKKVAFGASIFSFIWAGVVFVTILIPLLMGCSMPILGQIFFTLCIIFDFIERGFRFREMENKLREFEREEEENGN
jgi:predicted ABC-type exoprotein transport system permease subunit